MPIALEPIRARALAWATPLSAQAPAGTSAKQLPSYEFVVAEIQKLQSPSAASSVNWGKIVDAGREILSSHSKDLTIAAYLAIGLHATAGMEGLLEGSLGLAELMEQHWLRLWPEPSRIRARANALGWYVERGLAALSDPAAPTADRALLLALQQAIQRVAQLSREKLAADSPGFGALAKAAEQLLLSAPSAGETTPPANPSSASSPPAGVAPTAASAPPQPLLTGTVGPDQLRGVGTALIEAALLLRKANPADPTPYRILRTGLWLHLDSPPPRGSNGRTSLPSVPAARVAQLAAMEAHGKWPELIEEAEAALVSHRFDLNLQRATVGALEKLGPPYRAARDAAVAELRAWLGRVPTAPELLAQDGTPVANADTLAWLKMDVLAEHEPREPAAQGLGALSGEDEAFRAEMRGCARSDQLPEAARRIEARLASHDAERDRFGWRLFLAQLTAEAGQLGAARALYQALDDQCLAHGLDQWEPALATSCLAGLLRCARTGRPGGTLPPEHASQFQRLCRLSLSAALSTQG